MTSAMTQAGRRTEVQWTKVGRTSDRRRMEVGQTKVERTSDESWTDVRRTSEESRTCRAQPPLRRWQAATLHCSCSQRCNDGQERCSSQRCCGIGRQLTAACNVLPALLQQRAGRRNVAAMASNALDLTTLLR